MATGLPGKYQGVSHNTMEEGKNHIAKNLFDFWPLP
jgi:hypothetical protein